MCNKNQALEILGRVFTECNELFRNKIKHAYLYGSYARGDYNSNSDVDILLTVDMDASEISKYRSAVAKVTSGLSLDYDVTVSVTVKPLAQFIRFSNVLPYYQNVLKEGVPYAV